MQKIINAPQDFVDEVVAGILIAHSDDYRAASADRRAIVDAAAPRPGVVGIVTGGGSGHLPLFLGYVGPGLASGVAVGNVFSSPSPEQLLQATRAVDGGAGVLYLYGNYGGDVYNFDIAGDLAAVEGIRTLTVRGADDVLSAPVDAANTRRGVAGLVFSYKIAGASAARGDDLDTVAALCRRVTERTRTVGVGLAPAILPTVGKPTFELDEGEMEIGVGIHGEAGLARVSLETADDIVGRFLEHLSAEIEFRDGRFALLVNGLGATPPEELYLIASAMHRGVERAGGRIVHNHIGEYATSLEMAGASVSLVELDHELEELLLAPAFSPFYRPGTPAVGLAALDRRVVEAETEDSVELADGPSDVRAVIRRIAERLPAAAGELQELDAALGDGDLGVTVEVGSRAALARLDVLPENATTAVTLRAVAAAFAAANPSTFAALIGTGLIAAAGAGETQELTRADAVRMSRALSEAIVARGGARLGDKTLLDVLIPAVDDLEAGVAGDEVVARAWRRVDEVAALVSRRGRAAWHQERSRGERDPGSVAVARALEALFGE